MKNLSSYYSPDSCVNCSFKNPNVKPVFPGNDFKEVPVMFIGENPSRAENQAMPFDPKTTSGRALEKHYLNPLNLTRDQVWITDLIKCQYPKYMYKAKIKYKTKILETADVCANRWLVKEIEHTKPKVIVTLSNKEVYQKIRDIFHLDVPSDFNKAVGNPYPVTINRHSTLLFPMIHPDISRPVGEGDKRKLRTREKWAPLHKKKHIPSLKKILLSNE
jgi:uracil-DNA glycosylase family 4